MKKIFNIVKSHCLIIILIFIVNNSFSQPTMKVINHFGGNFHDQGRSILSDSEGNFIFCGNFNKSIEFKDTTLYSISENDLVFGKMDLSGNILWVNQIGGDFYWYNGVSTVEIDDVNNIYIYIESPTKYNLEDTIAGNHMIQKYSSKGDRLFTLQILKGEIYDFHEKLNSLYITGSDCQIKNGNDTITIQGNFILNFSNEGLYNWHKLTNNKYFRFEITDDSLIYLSSKILLDSIQETFSPTKIFIDKTDRFGNLLLSSQFYGSGYSGISEMAVNNESIFLAGYFFGTLDFGPNLIGGSADYFMIMLDKELKIKYAQKIENYDQGSGNLEIIADKNNCYFAFDLIGYFSPQSFIRSTGAYDNFIVKLDSLGQEVWHIQIGGAANTFPSDMVGNISINPQGLLLFAGSFSGQIEINGNIISSSGITYSDMIFLQIDISTFINPDLFTNEYISVYPNPCLNELFFSNSKENQVKLYNTRGILVFQSENEEFNQTINMSSFPEGLYFYQVINNHDQILSEGKIIHLLNH